MLKKLDSEVGTSSTDIERRQSFDKSGSICSLDDTREITTYTKRDDLQDEQPGAKEHQISQVLVKCQLCIHMSFC